MSFLALDAVLGWKVKHYDSSWIEWGNVSDEVEGWGQVLPTGSPWALNNATYTEVLNETPVNTTKQVSGCTTGFVAPNQTNDNDKQICTGTQQFDCNSNIN